MRLLRPAIQAVCVLKPQGISASLWPPQKLSPNGPRSGLQLPLRAALPRAEDLGQAVSYFLTALAPWAMGEPSPTSLSSNHGDSHRHFVTSAPTLVWGSLRAISSLSPVWKVMAESLLLYLRPCRGGARRYPCRGGAGRHPCRRGAGRHP